MAKKDKKNEDKRGDGEAATAVQEEGPTSSGSSAAVARVPLDKKLYEDELARCRWSWSSCRSGSATRA